MDSPEAPIDISPNESTQIAVSESVRAEYDRRPIKRVALAGAMFIGALAFAGCNNQEVDADDPAPVQPSSSEVVPSVEPDKESELHEAEATLAQFHPDIAPSLTNFSANPDHNKAIQDAERYLAGKDSKLVLINFSKTSPAEAEQIAEAVEGVISSVTAGTVHIEVDVVQASQVAKQLDHRRNPGQIFTPDSEKNYDSVIAAAVMPDINRGYNSVIALTDNQFQPGSEAEDSSGLSLTTGKYADVMNVSETEQLTNVNRIVHEYLHTVLRLQHAKSVMSEMGDFASAFPHESGAEQRANLAEFLSTATADEYGMENIMGDASRLFDSPPLTTAQLDSAGAAERMLNEPYLIKRSEPNEQAPVVYTEQSSENAIAVYQLDEPLQLQGRTDQGLNAVFTVEFTPQYYEGLWNVSFDGITYDNGVVNFMNMYLSNDPSQGHVEQIIDMPNGKSISVSITDTNELQIAVN